MPRKESTWDIWSGEGSRDMPIMADFLGADGKLDLSPGASIWQNPEVRSWIPNAHFSPEAARSGFFSNPKAGQAVLHNLAWDTQRNESGSMTPEQYAKYLPAGTDPSWWSSVVGHQQDSSATQRRTYQDEGPGILSGGDLAALGMFMGGTGAIAGLAGGGGSFLKNLFGGSSFVGDLPLASDAVGSSIYNTAPAASSFVGDLPLATSQSPGAFTGYRGTLDPSVLSGANTTGGGMDWFEQLMQSAGDSGAENMFNFEQNPWGGAGGFDLSQLGPPTNLQDKMTRLDSTISGSSDLNKIMEAGGFPGGGSDAAGNILARMAEKVGTSQAQSLFQKFLSSGDPKDLLGVLGGAAPGLLSEYFKSQQANNLSGSLTNIANQARADRAPFLDYATRTLQGGPEAYAAGAGTGALKGVLHKLSAGFGNPIGSPTALQIATDSSLNNWGNDWRQAANIGLGGNYSQLASNAAAAGAGTSGAGYGDAAASVFGTKDDLSSLLKRLQSNGVLGSGLPFG